MRTTWRRRDGLLAARHLILGEDEDAVRIRIEERAVAQLVDGQIDRRSAAEDLDAFSEGLYRRRSARFEYLH